LQNLKTLIPQRIRPTHFNRNSRSTRKLLECLRKIPMIVKLNKLKNIAPHFAAKAMKELTRGTHRKRRSFLVMKRTSAKIIGAGFFQRDYLSDHLNNIGRMANCIDVRTHFPLKTCYLIA